jgi:hypothetical protein
MDPKRKAEILAGIQDPDVRAHYEAQLDMAEELESEGLVAGGIFASPDRPGERIQLGLDEAMKDDAPALPEPWTPPAPPAAPPPEVDDRSFHRYLAFVILIALFVALYAKFCSGPH